MKKWNKKQVVAMQIAFYKTLSPIMEVEQIDSDFAFFLYDLIPSNDGKNLVLKLQKIVYTKFEIALEQIAKFEAGDVTDFIRVLEKKLVAKRTDKMDSTLSNDIIID